MDGVVQLPLHVVLTNNVAVSYFMDYLASVGGQNYIDCYLAIEVFDSLENELKLFRASKSPWNTSYGDCKQERPWTQRSTRLSKRLPTLCTSNIFLRR